MKQLLLILVMLFSSITYAQITDGDYVFDFSCPPTAEQIAMELRILTDERIELLADESSETTIISSEWSPEDGHIITIANSLKTILASDYGHRNFGKSETFDSLIEAVRKVVSRLDHIQTLATGDVKITHVYTYDPSDEFLMTAGTIGYNQDGNTDFGDSDYVIEDLEGTDLTDLYDKISSVVSQVQSEYDNPPLTLREMRLETVRAAAASSTTADVLITIEENYVAWNDKVYDRAVFSDLTGTISKTINYAYSINGQGNLLLEIGTDQDITNWIDGTNVESGFDNIVASFQLEYTNKRIDFVTQIEDQSTPTVSLTIDRLDVNPNDNDGLEDIIRYTVGGITSYVTLSKLLVDSDQDDIDYLITVILPNSIPGL